MEQESEVVSHSSRGTAAAVVTLVLLAAAWLVLTNRGASGDSSSPSGMSMTTLATTTPATPRSFTTGRVPPTSTARSSPSTIAVDDPWWLSVVGPDETDLMEHQLPNGGSLLLSSSSAAPDRVPVVRRLDPTTEAVLWESEGRGSTGWIGPVRLVDDLLVMFNRDSPDSAVMLAFDYATGSRLWISQFRLGIPLDPMSPTFVALGVETAVIVRTLEFGLVRVSLPTGSPLWKTESKSGVIQGPLRLREGRLGILLQSGETTRILDAETGESVALSPNPFGCITLRGPTPILYLFSPDSPGECVVIGAHQNLRIWNKGFDELTIGSDAELTVPSDEFVDLDELGVTLAPGDHSIGSDPYPLPVIRYVQAARSPWAGLVIGDDGIGGIRTGMSLTEASAIAGAAVTS